ncbi:hypothetical protein [Streptomyces violaceusniger]|uniref:hypothetical protein n=1 Tax=Streptomyces violaceusniger TaxID=68280 RepID=UPI00381EEF3B
MTNPASPKSLTSPLADPSPAQPAPAPDGRSAPKDVGRKAVPSALRPDQHQGDSQYLIAWLHITAPRGAVPTAHSWCACGHDRSAIGKPRVLALINAHEAHKTACPLRSSQEGAIAA